MKKWQESAYLKCSLENCIKIPSWFAGIRHYYSFFQYAAIGRTLFGKKITYFLIWRWVFHRKWLYFPQKTKFSHIKWSHSTNDVLFFHQKTTLHLRKLSIFPITGNDSWNSCLIVEVWRKSLGTMNHLSRRASPVQALRILNCHIEKKLTIYATDVYTRNFQSITNKISININYCRRNGQFVPISSCFVVVITIAVTVPVVVVVVVFGTFEKYKLQFLFISIEARAFRQIEVIYL